MKNVGDVRDEVLKIREYRNSGICTWKQDFHNNILQFTAVLICYAIFRFK